MKQCTECGKEIPKSIIIDGVEKQVSRNRSSCFDCSPFGTFRKGIVKQSLTLSEPHICKNCSKEFFEKYSKYSNGKFCCKSCSAKYTGSKQVFTTKIVKCITCGKEIEVHSRSSDKQCKCDECKNTVKYISSNNKKSVHRRCKICGQIKCLRKDICKKVRLFPALIKYFGFDAKKIGNIGVYEEYERIKNMLIEDYFDNEMSTIAMASKYNHDNIGNFSKLLKSLNIKLRNLSESSQLSWITGKQQIRTVIKYKQGYHTSWNNKEVFYRSSYEIDYCKELDELKVDYEMEKLRILYWDSQLLRQRVAIPDFYLPVTNEIIEIKSTWTYDEQNMKDKFKAYNEHGYKVKLILEHKEVFLQ